MKKFLHRLFVLFLCVLFLFITVFPAAAAGLPLDFGDNNDYGGGDWGGGNDWGGGGDYGGGSYFFFDDLDIPWWATLLIIIACVALFFIFKKNSGTAKKVPNTTSFTSTPTPQNREDVILPAIHKNDPAFDRNAFVAWVGECYITLQNAWMARNPELFRTLVTPEMFQQYKRQLDQYKQMGRINRLERININTSYLHHYSLGPEYEYITVYLAVRLTDYIIDEKTQQVLKGDPNVDSYIKYLLKFARKKGLTTGDTVSKATSVSCPHCGAALDITAQGVCAYCGSTVTTDDFQWTLCSYESIKPNTQLDNSGVDTNS